MMYKYFNVKEELTPEELIEYLRKSRTDDPLLSVEEVLQKHETILDEWCTKFLGATIPEENKYREVVSGESIDDRIEFQKLLKLIESPKIKAVLVVELQRLGRPDLEEIGRITKIFRYTGTKVITPERVYDLQNDDDRDSFERELKRGNEYLEYQKKIMNRGRLLSVSQGNFIGSIPPYGYDKTFIMEGKRKCPTLKENKEQADVVRLIFDLYVNKDMGRTSICNYLDNMHIKPPKGEYWSPPALKDMLENVHYIGKVRWNWRQTRHVVEDSEIIKTRPKTKMGEYPVYEGKHDGIVPEELFNAAQEKKGRNHRAKATTKVRNPLAGLLFCRCGRAMSLRIYKNKDGSERTPPRLLCDGQTHCNTGSCFYEEIISFVCDDILRKSIADFEMKMKEDNSDSVAIHNKLIKNLEKKLVDLEEREILLWEAKTNPDPEERMPPERFKDMRAKLLKDREETKNALANAYESMPNPIDYQQKIYRFQNALDTLLDDKASAEEKNRLLKQCIERIDYSREKPERLRSTGKRVTIDGRRVKPGGLKTGANWTNPPIELDVKLKV